MWIAVLVYAGATALLFHNLLPDLSTHIYSDLGDPLLNVTILAWNARQVPLTEAWWNFPSFAPLTGVTAFTEHLLLTYPVASPIVWASGNPVLAYNVAFLLAMPLNGLAAFALARELLRYHQVGGVRLQGGLVHAAALVAGLAFAFAPYQQVHLSHLQHMTSFGMPLALLWLHRYLRTGRPAALVGFGAGWLLAALANSALLVFLPLLVALWSAWFVRPGEWRRLIAPAAAAAIATIPLIPLLWGYHVRQAAYGFTREYREIQSFAADMVGLAGLYHRALPWKGILPHDFEEGALFPGVTTFVLALVATIAALGSRSRIPNPGPPLPDAASPWPHRLRLTFVVLTVVVLARIWIGPWRWHIGPLPLPPFRPYQLFTIAAIALLAGSLLSPAFRRAWSRRDLIGLLAVATVFFWLTALGPEPEWSTPWRALIYGPYRLLVELPGVTSMRVPARAWFPAVLCLALLAGFGASVLLGRYPRAWCAIVAVLSIATVVEGAFFDGTMAVPPPLRRGAIPPGATVLDLPWDEGYQNAVPQYRAVLGGYRSVNGYSGYLPAHVYPQRRAIADLVPTAFDSYRRRGDLYVIVRPELELLVARWIATQPGAEHLFDLDAARVYLLPHEP
ncbi:MAG: hypothetical protein A3I61_10030 [Acidobacteria bacterium RIFCSPLOWO2_02_FULL_68_18]|nr:MAG: hypothetical protein A3I61_10030 [Acidobacteria bacterium RIFCSPLOWO2_02_FULL_68_18]OFW50960.1 MAG: hypothetical protein A3G77_15135 [Acidobacteria bacterium RIFCSPLOWO2_12_FULL_68_19]